MRFLLLVLFASSCGEPMTADAGVDGGRVGIDAGTDGGGGVEAGACAVAPGFVAADLSGKAGFDPGGATSPPFNFATMSRASAADAGRFDVMFNEFYAGAVVGNALIPAANYGACTLCYVIRSDCDTMGRNCARSYLARSGSVTVSEATQDAGGGRLAFQLNNVVYQRWDFTSDTAMDAGCLALSRFSFTGSWP